MHRTCNLTTRKFKYLSATERQSNFSKGGWDPVVKIKLRSKTLVFQGQRKKRERKVPRIQFFRDAALGPRQKCRREGNTEFG